MRTAFCLMILGVGGVLIGCGSEDKSSDLTTCTSTPIAHGQSVTCESAAGGEGMDMPPGAPTGTASGAVTGSGGRSGGSSGGGEEAPVGSSGAGGSSGGGDTSDTSGTSGTSGTSDSAGTGSSSGGTSDSTGTGSSSGGTSSSSGGSSSGGTDGSSSEPTCTTNGSSQHCVYTKCDPGYMPWQGCCVPKGNNGVGNGLDPQPPGNPPVNDGVGTSPGDPGNKP